jgi:hypothetical protein
MTATIQNHHVEAYKDNVTHLSQQKMSRLRSTVTSESINALIHNFDRMGLTEAVSKAADQVTPNIEVPHDRRQVVLAEYNWAARINRGDEIFTLIDIKGKYAVNGAMAIARKWDDLIIAAASADATAKVPAATKGEYTTSSVALPSSQKIISSIGGNTTMNLGKLLAAKEQLMSSDVDLEYEPVHCVISSKQLHELLAVTEITSADYNSVKALVNGEINTYLGMKFIHSERLAVRDNSGTDETVALVYCPSAIGLAIGEDVTARASERDDLSYTNQIYLEFVAAATRLEEEKVIEILTVK